MSLFIVRISTIKPTKTIKRFSKESFISINNIFFGVLIFSIMLGVTYPLIYEFLFDQKISVGAPFYNAIFIPIVILACVFMFFSIDSKWSRNINFYFFTTPISISIFVSIITIFLVSYFFKTGNFAILISLFAGFIIIYRYVIEIFNSFFSKKYLNPFSAIAHFALGLLIISISFNSLLSTERALNIKINESEQYKDLKIYFKDIKVLQNSNHDSIQATFMLEDQKGRVFDLNPEKRRYFTRGQITTETAIFIMPLKDIYITIGDQLDDGSWIVNIQINYLIRLIWFSAGLMAIAGMVLIFSRKNI
jgi:cytochrome c-type biogenesis protein CcmF